MGLKFRVCNMIGDNLGRMERESLISYCFLLRGHTDDCCGHQLLIKIQLINR